MVSCPVLEIDEKGEPEWVIQDFCLGVLNAETTKTDLIAGLLEELFGRPAIQATRITSKTGSGTCDGGANLKCLMEAVKSKVNCTDIVPDMRKSIASECHAHLISTVR